MRNSRLGRAPSPPGGRILRDHPQESVIGAGILRTRTHADRAGASSCPQRFSKPDAGTAILNFLPTASDCHRLMGRRRRTSRCLLPQPAVLERFFDHLALIPLNEADDLHRRAALEAA